jgi:hypothetical protein
LLLIHRHHLVCLYKTLQQHCLFLDKNHPFLLLGKYLDFQLRLLLLVGLSILDFLHRRRLRRLTIQMLRLLLLLH